MLWFDDKAEEAANMYVSIFKNSKLGNIARYGESGSEVSGVPQGKVMTVEFELDGQHFTALNGGPIFTFTEAVSFVIDCKDQVEVDEMWDKLLAGGGQPGQCGWLKDKFGLSWQVVPEALGDLMSSGTPEQSERVMAAMLTMTKMNVAELQAAYDGAA